MLKHITERVKENDFIFEIIFFLTSGIGVFFVLKGAIHQDVLMKTIRYVSLFFFYKYSVKKMNNYILGFLAISLLTAVFIVNGYFKLFPLCLVFCLRLFLLSYLIRIIKWKRDLVKNGIFVFFMILFLGILACSIYVHWEFLYQNISYFSIIILIETTLIMLLLLALVNVLGSIKRGNLILFVGVSLFVIADVVLGLEDISKAIYGGPLAFLSFITGIGQYCVVRSNILLQTDDE